MTHSLAFTSSALCISNKDPANEIPIHLYFPLHKFTNLDVLDPVQKVSKFVQIEICNKLPFFFFFTRLPCPCFFKAAKRRMQRQNLYLRTTKCVPHFPKYEPTTIMWTYSPKWEPHFPKWLCTCELRFQPAKFEVHNSCPAKCLCWPWRLHFRDVLDNDSEVGSD